MPKPNNNDRRKGGDNERDGERMWFKDLTEKICALTCVLQAGLEQRKTEFDWLKSHAGLTTKQDLKETELRLTDAIGRTAQIDTAIEAASRREGKALDRLDAQVPDRK